LQTPTNADKLFTAITKAKNKFAKFAKCKKYVGLLPPLVYTIQNLNVRLEVGHPDEVLSVLLPHFFQANNRLTLK
jgi:hypothetical protein